ncbi:MAG: BMP family ABC transporter substrate-binding protein [Eubacteriales bacterium]|nr:BMP family ABC transporter substrate-binding protein [Eubacteriales bacterium]MDD4390797.1 BMP family ABC transporter substrate-binding protein [Eubacteriales bacterium]
MKKITKLTLIILSLSLIFAMTSCAKEEKVQEADENLVILVTDERGLGNGGINDICWEGAEKAKDDFGINPYCISSTSPEGYMQALKQAVSMEPLLIIAVSDKFEPALMDVATAYKEQRFAIVGAGEIGDNVAGITFNDQEAAFLVGIASAMTTKTNTVGFIGGERSAEQDRYEYGFDAGVTAAKKGTYVSKNYIGTFTDGAEAKKVAVAQNALGADIVYAPIQEAYIGVLEAASEKKINVIGSGNDFADKSENILCVTVRKSDTAVYDIIKKVASGKFDGKDINYGLKQGGIEISNEAGKLSADVMKEVEKYSELIKAGSIIVPYDWQTNFEYQATLK